MKGKERKGKEGDEGDFFFFFFFFFLLPSSSSPTIGQLRGWLRLRMSTESTQSPAWKKNLFSLYKRD